MLPQYDMEDANAFYEFTERRALKAEPVHQSILDIFTDTTRADILMRLAWDPDGTLVIHLKEPMSRVQFLADEIPLVRQFLENGPC